MDDTDNKDRRKLEIGRLIMMRRKAMVPAMSQTRLGNACGWEDHQYIQKIENGERGVSGDELVKIAEALDIDPRELVGAAPKRRQVPLLGDVGVGGEYFAHAGVGRWMEIKRVDAPLGDETVNAAVRVVGNHLESAGYWDGDMLFFRRPGEDLDELVGKRCIVQMRDGAALLGVLSRSSRPGKWLFKPLADGETTREIAVEWAARIRWHQQA